MNELETCSVDDKCFIANFLLNPRVKGFWKSANIRKVMNEKYRWYFFDSQCIFSKQTFTDMYTEIHTDISCFQQSTATCKNAEKPVR